MELIETRPFFESIFTVDDFGKDDIVLNNILEMRKVDDGNHISNRHGWQSKPFVYDSHEWMQPSIDKMRPVIKKVLNLYGISREPDFSPAYWFNVNSKGSYNVQHNHAGITLSAVWYLQTPPNCGNIEFQRPTSHCHDWMLPDQDTEHTYTAWWVESTAGRLVVFPSYLVHSVAESFADEDRVSIAFNFGVPRK